MFNKWTEMLLVVVTCVLAGLFIGAVLHYCNLDPATMPKQP